MKIVQNFMLLVCIFDFNIIFNFCLIELITQAIWWVNKYEAIIFKQESHGEKDISFPIGLYCIIRSLELFLE